MKKLNNILIENRDWLLRKYIDERKSTYQIAKEQNVCEEVIRKRLIKYNIDRREKSEAMANHIQLSPKLLELLEGNLLGDGCQRAWLKNIRSNNEKE